jgi:hypothetical protein
MRKIILSISLVLMVIVTTFGQGDCFNSATVISSCGYVYGGNNATFGACAGDKCGCVGGGSNPSNLDNDCSTTYSGGNCGSDFQGSVENSMFWYFSPTESCDYQLCITAENCCCAQGAGADYMQVWIGQRDTTTGLVSAYHVNDNNNTSITGGNTICYTFSVDQNDGDVVIMTDGNAGSECDIYLDINQVDCSDTCPIIVMSVKWLDFRVKSSLNRNIITWDVSEQNTNYFCVEKSRDAVKFQIIHSVNANDEKSGSYTYTDNDTYNGLSYYRIKEVDPNGKISYSKISSVYNNFEVGRVIERYDVTGNPVDSTYRGIVIEKYESGHFKKVMQNR